MGSIVVLDELTINKIAAGEVIERPASVIKEMIENSIDAGAKNINIEIQNGGISYIRITDDGKGIEKEDLELAFERHATSKIRQAEDLNEVKSMGFRGEALASIAAIAKVEMKSKTKDASIGNRIVVEGGNILDVEECGCPNGTTITVQNLFYNTPVRYKFLKKDYTETGYIEDAVTRLSLVHPEIAFKLINSGKTIIQTTGDGDIKNVIYSIYGKSVAGACLNVNYTYEGITVTGVVGKPEIARSNRGNQIFFVNKRYIKDRILSNATEKAFKGMIPIGKFGFLVLNLEMAPSAVDVNVHPAKLEVRFEEEQKVFKAVYYAIQDTLLKAELIANSETPITGKFEKNENINEAELENTQKKSSITDLFRRITKNADKEEVLLEEPEKYETKPINLQEIKENIQSEEPSVNQNSEEQTTEMHDEIVAGNILANIVKERTEEENKEEKEDKEEKENKEDKEVVNEDNFEEKFEDMYKQIFGKSISAKKNEQKQEDEEKKANAEDIANTNMNIIEDSEKFKDTIPYKFIGIAFKTYIILEIENELYILDQHAAHERIMYEKVKKNYYSEEQKDSQLMLLPDIITLTHKEMDIARENMDKFQKAGFVLEEFGENTIKLTGVPNICLDLDTKDLFLETLDEINTVARTAKQEIEERFIATIACKAAVKANMALTEEEVTSLLDELLKLPNPFTCPHGRPTAIKLSKTDIEKKFARRK